MAHLDDLPAGVEVCERSGEGGTYRFFFNDTMDEKGLMVDGHLVTLEPLGMAIESDEGWK
jgi:hypothetical protein